MDLLMLSASNQPPLDYSNPLLAAIQVRSVDARVGLDRLNRPPFPRDR